MTNKSLKFIDFCAGIGGGRLGLEANGLTCVAHSEIDCDADNTYKIFHSKNELNIGDLMTADISSIPDFDLMISKRNSTTFSIQDVGTNGNASMLLAKYTVLKEMN